MHNLVDTAFTNNPELGWLVDSNFL